REHGIGAFELEARLIVERASGKRRQDFIRDGRLYPPDGKFERATLGFLSRRLSGEPVAYITGEWEFYSLPMLVSRDILIPRADTELLASRAIAVLRTSRRSAPKILDLCCGCGCVGLAVAANIAPCRVVLSDKYESALKLARENTLRNGLSKQVTSSPADALASPPPLFGTFDMLVCNPPYIKTSDIDALDGGEDGLMFYRSVSAKWKTLLRAGGHLLFECGVGQAASVARIMADEGFSEIRMSRDTAGIDRVVEGRRE
ncbi:MAG: peptide chain release factor N(5)-glutamine methyltransferase, partial [Oscillospiraceae bacterium]|nr:peptide chain release factor N(5)-glutamine methyltransferase [Oscillospiraceae bacterium]